MTVSPQTHSLTHTINCLRVICLYHCQLIRIQHRFLCPSCYPPPQPSKSIINSILCVSECHWIFRFVFLLKTILNILLMNLSMDLNRRVHVDVHQYLFIRLFWNSICASFCVYVHFFPLSVLSACVSIFLFCLCSTQFQFAFLLFHRREEKIQFQLTLLSLLLRHTIKMNSRSKYEQLPWIIYHYSKFCQFILIKKTDRTLQPVANRFDGMTFW